MDETIQQNSQLDNGEENNSQSNQSGIQSSPEQVEPTTSTASTILQAFDQLQHVSTGGSTSTPSGYKPTTNLSSEVIPINTSLIKENQAKLFPSQAIQNKKVPFWKRMKAVHYGAALVIIALGVTAIIPHKLISPIISRNLTPTPVITQMPMQKKIGNLYPNYNLTTGAIFQ